MARLLVFAAAGLALAAPPAAAAPHGHGGGAEAHAAARGHDGGATAPKPVYRGAKAAGGAAYGAPTGRPRLTAFTLSARTLAATARFRFAGVRRARDVRVAVVPAAGGKPVRTLRLGNRRTGGVRISATGLPPGAYRVRIGARGLRRSQVSRAIDVTVPAPPPPPTAVSPTGRSGVFPIRGSYSYGGAEGRFGHRRHTHVHQGQDIAADAGTPVVAPVAGRVKVVRYQASGAGHYVVLRGTADGRDYVFMHLQGGSTVVAVDQRVGAGERLAAVGSSGRSSGPHLHFEIWVGGWYDGGAPIDPLPLLRAWAGR